MQEEMLAFPKDNLVGQQCWFCKKRNAVVKYAYVYETITNLKTSWSFFTRTTRYKKSRARAPRCKNCFEVHKTQTLLYSFIYKLKNKSPLLDRTSLTEKDFRKALLEEQQQDGARQKEAIDKIIDEWS
jgi:hypothetical protein